MKKQKDNGITTARIVKEVYSKTCPECQTEITSEYKDQLKWNFQIHHQACKKKQKKQKEKNNEKL